MALDPVPFGHWTLRDEAAQRRSALRWTSWVARHAPGAAHHRIGVEAVRSAQLGRVGTPERKRVHHRNPSRRISAGSRLGIHHGTLYQCLRADRGHREFCHIRGHRFCCLFRFFHQFVQVAHVVLQ